MTVRYAVTFEFLALPPLTHRGTVTAASVGTCMRRATQDAARVLHPVHWSSVNCVLLERVVEEAQPVDPVPEAETGAEAES